VRITSIGWQTDIALRRLEGAELIAEADYAIVRTPAIGDFRWGNFMLLPSAPGPGEAARWIERFGAAFPAARYLAIGIDEPPRQPTALEEFAALGLRVQIDAVLTAQRMIPPAKPPPAAEFRRLHGDGDWRRAVELSLAASDPDNSSGSRDFLQRRMAAIRRACETGRGAWFGAFRDGEMHAGLGIFDAGDGLARFQSVDTHPAHRRQGLASHLLYAAGRYANTQLGARTLVIAADPEYHAIGIYESLGFSAAERHVQLERLDART
jgi:ribosomal protein S18 acetylase RimI-like enzyme